MPTIGFLRSGPPPQAFVEGFQQGLRELGYVEGQNIIIEYRFADRGAAQLDELGSELLRLNVNVILASATPAAAAAKNLTRTVPIVITEITVSLTSMRSTAITKRSSPSKGCECWKDSSRDGHLRSSELGGNYMAMNSKGIGSRREPTGHCSRLRPWSEESQQ